jgi:1-acyl-sn-glycerol-3-phosphate acyltransferase
MLRRCRRAVALASALMVCVLRVGAMRLGGRFTPMRRSLWMQWCCRLIMSWLGIRCEVEGKPPSHGLVVSNHLTYLDVLIYGAAAPSVFVSKAEVSKWPFFGWITGCAGTLYIDRSSLASAEAVSTEIAGGLSRPIPIVIFPEGTSSDGTSVMRFHSRLFEPVVAAGAPITAAAIRYSCGDGTPESELCWYGDDDFLANLWKVFGVSDWHAEVRFGEPRIYPDRRTAADMTRDEVEAMRLSLVGDAAELSIH